MHIQVRVNEDGALRNQRFAFTDRYTLVSELLQNARRAGATRVRIRYDHVERVLRVSDNGSGVRDFQSLLDLHVSGWDESTRRSEHPFGAGFSKCLYAATRCVVRSGSRFVDFATALALERKPIAVHVDAQRAIEGTEVELHGVDLPDLGHRIDRMCGGFPLPVIYNDRMIDRPYAEATLDTTTTAIGTIYLSGTVSGNFTGNTLVFLQGFPVMSPRNYNPARVNVVHLDPERFMARLPDRDQLIDEQEHAALIAASIRQQWRDVLGEARQRLAPRAFIDRFYDAMRAFRSLDLLNDLDVLPRQSCGSIARYPTLVDIDEVLDLGIDPPERVEVLNANVLLVDLDDLDERSAALWMYARAKGFLLLNAYMLHDAHWAHHCVRKLRRDMIQVSPIGKTSESEFKGAWVSTRVVLCDAVRLEIDGDPVEISDEAVHHAGTLYVPAGESSGRGVGQLSNYIDDYNRQLLYERNNDERDLAELLHRLRYNDPAMTLDAALRGLMLDRYPVLHGRTFQVTVQPHAAPSIRLIE